MKIVMWHVHGSYMTALVQGSHEFLVPTLPERGSDGRGRAVTWDWPANVVERTPSQLQGERPDLVVLQRPHEIDLLAAWTGLVAGRDVPAVYLEHNAPQGPVNDMRHPMADRLNVPVVHVTHFNRLFWDCGNARTFVVEHGVIDPGHRYTGELPRCAVVINEARRRARVTGTDLLARFDAAMPVDVFGMDAAHLGGFENLPQERMHDEIARRRVYVHPVRWTSLGLSLIEAMYLGMPVVALATTEVPHTVPSDVGVTSTDVDALVSAGATLLGDPERCLQMGRRARAYASERFAVERFLADWNRVFEEVVP